MTTYQESFVASVSQLGLPSGENRAFSEHGPLVSSIMGAFSSARCKAGKLKELGTEKFGVRYK